MNKNIMQSLFPDEMKLIEEGRCPCCTNHVDKSRFTDPLDYEEFNISGLCKHCMDQIFSDNQDCND